MFLDQMALVGFLMLSVWKLCKTRVEETRNDDKINQSIGILGPSSHSLIPGQDSLHGLA